MLLHDISSLSMKSTYNIAWITLFLTSCGYPFTGHAADKAQTKCFGRLTFTINYAS